MMEIALWICVLLSVGKIESNAEHSPVPRLLFYKVFTPMKLATAASFVHHHHSLSATQLTFLSAPSNFYRLMKVPLIPPGIIEADANLVVKMVVGTDQAIGQGESDPSFVISDGKFFAGLHTRDKNNYKSVSPCLVMEGTSGTVIGGRRHGGAELPIPSESYYPGRFEIQLSLSDRWGRCFVPLDGGFSREMIYQNKLNPQNGLFLEIYGDDKTEKVGIKYIELSIQQESD